MNPLDPKEPLPRWEPKPGLERDPERIGVLLDQLESLWSRYPNQRLGQLIANVAGLRAADFFYLEDHFLSQKICEVRDTGRWPSHPEAE